MTKEPAATPNVKLGYQLSASAVGFGAMTSTPVYGDVDDTESPPPCAAALTSA